MLKLVPAPLWRRASALVYDFFLAGVGIVLISNIVIAIFGTTEQSLSPDSFRGVEVGSLLANLVFALQIVLAILYFTFCWSKIGKTAGMKAWKLILMDTTGKQVLSWQLALARSILALFSWSVFGVGILWMLFDRERQPLHDRLLNTRLYHLK